MGSNSGTLFGFTIALFWLCSAIPQSSTHIFCWFKNNLKAGEDVKSWTFEPVKSGVKLRFSPRVTKQYQYDPKLLCDQKDELSTEALAPESDVGRFTLLGRLDTCETDNSENCARSYEAKMKRLAEKTKGPYLIILVDNCPEFQGSLYADETIVHVNESANFAKVFGKVLEGQDSLPSNELLMCQQTDTRGNSINLGRGANGYGSGMNDESTVGNTLTSFSKTSVLFVSVSFIILMVISLAWLVFYYVQRFRYAHAKDRLARRLFNAAKKALTKIPAKSLRQGDKELDSDCPVCIEPYRPHDIVRILPCKHVFHKTCVDPWLLEHRTCPMCKMDILKAFGYSFTKSDDSMQNIEGDRISTGPSSGEGGGMSENYPHPMTTDSDLHDPFFPSPIPSPSLLQTVLREDSAQRYSIIPLTVHGQISAQPSKEDHIPTDSSKVLSRARSSDSSESSDGPAPMHRPSSISAEIHCRTPDYFDLTARERMDKLKARSDSHWPSAQVGTMSLCRHSLEGNYSQFRPQTTRSLFVEDHSVQSGWGGSSPPLLINVPPPSSAHRGLALGSSPNRNSPLNAKRAIMYNEMKATVSLPSFDMDTETNVIQLGKGKLKNTGSFVSLKVVPKDHGSNKK